MSQKSFVLKTLADWAMMSLQRRPFFSYIQTAQKWKFTVPSWLGDDKARHRGVHVGPGMKLSRIRKFEDENGHFHSLGTEVSFRR